MTQSEVENRIFSGVNKSKLGLLTDKIDKCLDVANEKDPKHFHNALTEVTMYCQEIIHLIKDLKLPIFNPRWCDAGPGVR